MDKQQALLEFLNEELDQEYELDDLEECSYDENSFAVNTHKTRHGKSPSEILENAARVRTVLSELFPTVKQESWTSARINERVYRILDRRLRAKIWPDDKTGIIPEGTKHDNNKATTFQDIVNFVFHLYDDSDYCEDYRKAARQAFNTGKCEEYRKLTSTQDSEYLVLTAEESEELEDQRLESYIDDCVIPELADNLAMYFDRDAFKHDLEIESDAGQQLATYDGEEHEHKDFYIYRTN